MMNRVDVLCVLVIFYSVVCKSCFSALVNNNQGHRAFSNYQNSQQLVQKSALSANQRDQNAVSNTRVYRAQSKMHQSSQREGQSMHTAPQAKPKKVLEIPQTKLLLHSPAVEPEKGTQPTQQSKIQNIHQKQDESTHKVDPLKPLASTRAQPKVDLKQIKVEKSSEEDSSQKSEKKNPSDQSQSTTILQTVAVQPENRHPEQPPSTMPLKVAQNANKFQSAKLRQSAPVPQVKQPQQPQKQPLQAQKQSPRAQSPPIGRVRAPDNVNRRPAAPQPVRPTETHQTRTSVPRHHSDNQNCQDYDRYTLNKLLPDPELHWNVALLHAPGLKNNASIDEMVHLNVLHEHKNGYLSTNKNGNLAWCGTTGGRHLSEAVPGTTLWVNEQMHLGHSPHDLWVLQALASTKVDRIVLQRAPCVEKSTLCQGKGTWVKFFKGMYASMIDAFQPGIPIYFRFKPDDQFNPHYLSISDGNVIEKVRGNEVFSIDSTFQHVIRKNITYVMDHYDNFVTPSAVAKFKQSAYKLINKNSTIVAGDIKNTTKPIVVTFAHRSASSDGGRTMKNVQETITKFSELFPAPRYSFRPYLTPDIHSDATFADDIRVMHETDVLISEHGAYQANVIYMRRGCLFVDLAGIYWGVSSAEYNYRQFPQVMQKVIRNFGVFYRRVYLHDLSDHGLRSYKMSEMEMNEAASVVDEYVKMYVQAR